MLSVSYVMRISGLGVGALMLVVGASLAFLSTTALMRMSAQTGHDTYAGLFSHCGGRAAGIVLDAMLFIYGNGSCVGYFIFIADFVPSLVSLVAPSAPEWLAGRVLAILVAALIISPMALQKDVSVLRYVAPMSILALMYMAMTVAVRAPSLYHEHLGDVAHGPVRWAVPTVHVCEAFAICVFAFNCHINVLPVAGSMVRPTRSRIIKISMRVNLLQCCFYSLIGITGYLSFLAKTPQDFIKAYHFNDGAVAVGRLMLTGTMLVAIPINLLPTVRSGLQLADHLRGAGAREPQLLGSEGCNQGGSSIRAPLDPVRERLRIALSILCLAMQAVVAILVPGVADVIGILGATVATAMMMAIPAFCMGVIMPVTVKNRLQQAVLYFFSLVSLASVPIKVLGWAKVIS